MVQKLKITGKERQALPVPDWLNKPVTGEEAQQRAKKYEERMQQVSEGRDKEGQR